MCLTRRDIDLGIGTCFEQQNPSGNLEKYQLIYKCGSSGNTGAFHKKPSRW